MAKGSGRRRKTPADGLKYDPETETTSLDKIGAKSFESRTYHWLYHDPGAQPTCDSWYGSCGKRWGGNGRKQDHRNWKNYTKGNQYNRHDYDSHGHDQVT